MVTLLAAGVLLALCSACVLTAARARRSAHQARSSAAQAELQRAAALHRATMARRNERALIAADVHDDSIQVITAALMQVRDLAARLADPDDRARALRAGDELAQALGRLRRLVFDLDVETDDDTPLEAACRSLVEQTGHGLQVCVDIDADGLVDEPAGAARSLLLRNLREAVANAVRHGDPANVIIRLRSIGGGTEVEVSDDGSGFDVLQPALEGHLGLRSMRHRVERAGGRFELVSVPGSGTTVASWVPDEMDLRSVHETSSHGGGDGLEPRVGTELGQDVLNVVANGVEAQEQPLRDRLAR